jgi:hypothetical protein
VAAIEGTATEAAARARAGITIFFIIGLLLGLHARHPGGVDVEKTIPALSLI